MKCSNKSPDQRASSQATPGNARKKLLGPWQHMSGSCQTVETICPIVRNLGSMSVCSPMTWPEHQCLGMGLLDGHLWWSIRCPHAIMTGWKSHTRTQMKIYSQSPFCPLDTQCLLAAVIHAFDNISSDPNILSLPNGFNFTWPSTYTIHQVNFGSAPDCC